MITIHGQTAKNGKCMHCSMLTNSDATLFNIDLCTDSRKCSLLQSASMCIDPVSLIPFDELRSTSIHFDPLQRALIPFDALQSCGSTLTHCDQVCPCSIHFDPIRSTSIPFDALRSTSIHFDPLRSTSIPFDEIRSTSIHFDPLTLRSIDHDQLRRTNIEINRPRSTKCACPSTTHTV